MAIIKVLKSIRHHGVTLPVLLVIRIPPQTVPCLQMEAITHPALLVVIHLVLLAINPKALQIQTQTTKHPQEMEIPLNRTIISHQTKVLQEMVTHPIQMKVHLNQTTISHQTKVPLNQMAINPETLTKPQTIKPPSQITINLVTHQAEIPNQATISHQVIKAPLETETPLNQIPINHKTIKLLPNPIAPNQTKVVLIKIPLVVTNLEVAGVPLTTKPVVVKAVAMVIVQIIF